MDEKFIAYYRVSTDHQGVNGNGMAAQLSAAASLVRPERRLTTNEVLVETEALNLRMQPLGPASVAMAVAQKCAVFE
jgi:hypothetical protein